MVERELVAHGWAFLDVGEEEGVGEGGEGEGRGRGVVRGGCGGWGEG